MLASFVPYIASLTVMWVTSKPTLGANSAILPLVVDAVLFFPVFVFPDDAFVGIVWLMAQILNIFLLFPLGLVIGIYRDRQRSAGVAP